MFAVGLCILGILLTLDLGLQISESLKSVTDHSKQDKHHLRGVPYHSTLMVSRFLSISDSGWEAWAPTKFAKPATFLFSVLLWGSLLPVDVFWYHGEGLFRMMVYAPSSLLGILDFTELWARTQPLLWNVGLGASCSVLCHVGCSTVLLACTH